MKKRIKIILFLVVSLIIWSIVAIFAISNPVPKEPDNLPPEAWSYYRERPPLEVFLIKNRDAILLVVFLCWIIPDLALLIDDYRK
jgi:flagellar basal body-associated protein FliL